MDEQIKERIALGVCSRKIMEVVIDKPLPCEACRKRLYGRGIPVLQPDHCNGRAVKLLKLNENVNLCKRLAGRLLNEQGLPAYQDSGGDGEMGRGRG